MEIKTNNLTLSLSDDLESMNSFIKCPFVVFEKNNFIDDSSYDKLKKELYQFSNFDHTFSTNGNKKKFTVGGYNIRLINNGVFKSLCESILSKSFYNWFEKTHLCFFDDKKFKFKISNPRSRFIRLCKFFSNIFFIPVDFYYAEIEYSSLKQGAFIPPHTDDPKKRLSFVFYVPDNNLSDENKENLGTVFWKSKLKQNSNDEYHHIGPDKVNEFELANDIFHIASFEPNKISGFIPCENSWHSVKENVSDIDRRVIVINYWKM